MNEHLRVKSQITVEANQSKRLTQNLGLTLILMTCCYFFYFLFFFLTKCWKPKHGRKMLCYHHTVPGLSWTWCCFNPSMHDVLTRVVVVKAVNQSEHSYLGRLCCWQFLSKYSHPGQNLNIILFIKTLWSVK